MKKPLILAAIALAVTASADSLRSQILAMDQVIGAAMMKKDFSAMDKCMRAGMASNFVYSEGGRKMDYAKMLANMKMGLGMMTKITRAKATLVSLKMKGNTAKGTTSHVMTGTVMGPDKKAHTLAFSGISADSYVKQGGEWKLAKMEWKSQEEKMDGKKLDPAKMGGQ